MLLLRAFSPAALALVFYTHALARSYSHPLVGVRVHNFPHHHTQLQRITFRFQLFTIKTLNPYTNLKIRANLNRYANLKTRVLTSKHK